VARGCPKRTVVRAPAGYGVTVGCPTPAVARGPGRLRRGGGARPSRQWCAGLGGYEVGEGLGDAVTDAPGFGLAWCFGVAVGVGTAGGGE
jgi:hypothetical protein